MKKALLAATLFTLSFSVFAGCNKKDAAGWWAIQDQKTIGTIFFGWGGKFYKKELTDATFTNTKPSSHGTWTVSPNCIMTLNTSNSHHEKHDDHEPEFKQSFIVLIRPSDNNRSEYTKTGLFQGGTISRLK